MVELPDLPPKGDVTDWKEAGHTRDEFIRIVEDTTALDAAALEELARRWCPPAKVEEEPEEDKPEPEETQLDLSLTPHPSLWTGLAQQYYGLAPWGETNSLDTVDRSLVFDGQRRPFRA